jgi:hypothetical protein
MLLTQAIAIVETGNRWTAPHQDERGLAVSVFQIHRPAWLDVKRAYGTRTDRQFLDVGEHFQDIAGNDQESMIRAQNTANGYLAIIKRRLLRAGTSTSAANIYGCWNLGFDGFKRRHFNLKECPLPMRRNAARVSLLADNGRINGHEP